MFTNFFGVDPTFFYYFDTSLRIELGNYHPSRNTGPAKSFIIAAVFWLATHMGRRRLSH
jgi:hypothetical protein